MKTLLRISSREVGNYEIKIVEIRNTTNTIPREGERITVKGGSYDVKNVHYDFDNNKITISCL